MSRPFLCVIEMFAALLEPEDYSNMLWPCGNIFWPQLF